MSETPSSYNGFIIYFAAPLFSNAERAWNKRLRDYLVERTGYTVFLPQERCAGHPPEDIYPICKGGVDRSQMVLAILEGSDADSGTSWEAGYAKGCGKPVVGVRTDFRKCEYKNVNMMLYASCDVMVEDFSGSDEKLFAKIVEAIRTVLYAGT